MEAVKRSLIFGGKLVQYLAPIMFFLSPPRYLIFYFELAHPSIRAKIIESNLKRDCPCQRARNSDEESKKGSAQGANCKKCSLCIVTLDKSTPPLQGPGHVSHVINKGIRSQRTADTNFSGLSTPPERPQRVRNHVSHLHPGGNWLNPYRTFQNHHKFLKQVSGQS